MEEVLIPLKEVIVFVTLACQVCMEEGTALCTSIKKKPLSLIFNVGEGRRNWREPLVWSEIFCSVFHMENPGTGSMVECWSDRPNVSETART